LLPHDVVAKMLSFTAKGERCPRQIACTPTATSLTWRFQETAGYRDRAPSGTPSNCIRRPVPSASRRALAPRCRTRECFHRDYPGSGDSRPRDQKIDPATSSERKYKRAPYPRSSDEPKALFQEQPAYLARMSILKVSIGHCALARSRLRTWRLHRRSNHHAAQRLPTRVRLPIACPSNRSEDSAP